jgi:tRNA-dihydrouridine synthase
MGVSGVFVGRGVLRNPWILAQAQDILEGRLPQQISPEQRGRFLLEYIELLLNERVDEAAGFRHVAPSEHSAPAALERASRHDRWVINKLRALCTWYTKGIDDGSHLRVAVNAAGSLTQLRGIIEEFFISDTSTRARALVAADVG